MSTSTNGFEYLTCLHKLEAVDGRNLATFYLMNTSPNRNKWGVSDKALIEALPTITRAPLGLDKNYRGKLHPQNPIDVAKFVSFEKPNGYCTATAEIEDQKAWELLKTRKLGPISVVITPYRAECSKCGQAFSGQTDMRSHACVKAGKAYGLIKSFKFDRVDFVDNPAYPQAGVLKIGAQAQGILNPLKLCASAYESQFQNNLAPGSDGTNPVKARKGEKMEKTEEQLQAELDKALKKVKKLEAEAEENTKKLEELEAKKDEPEKSEEFKELKSQLEKTQKQLDAIKEAQHEKLLSAAVDARYEAKMIAKKDDERERLKDFSDSVLEMMAIDAQAVKTRLEAKAPPKPLTQYKAGEDGMDDFSKAVLKARADRGIIPLRKEAN